MDLHSGWHTILCHARRTCVSTAKIYRNKFKLLLLLLVLQMKDILKLEQNLCVDIKALHKTKNRYSKNRIILPCINATSYGPTKACWLIGPVCLRM